MKNTVILYSTIFFSFFYSALTAQIKHRLVQKMDYTYSLSGTATQSDSSGYTYTGSNGGNGLGAMGLVGTGTGEAHTTPFRPATYTRYTKTSGNNSFSPATYQSYVYDGVGNTLETIQQNWVNSAWVNHTKTTSTYNTQGKIIQQRAYTWVSNAWAVSSGYDVLYDATGLKIVEVNTYTNSLTPVYKEIYTYNAQNMLTIWLRKSYNMGTWLDLRRETNTYNMNNQLSQKIIEGYNTTTNAWIPEYRNNYIYINSLISYIIQETYNTTTSSWVNFYRYSYIYNTNNAYTEQSISTWSATTNTWNPTMKEEYTFDANFNCTQHKRNQFDNTAGAYITYTVYTYSYNAESNLIKKVKLSLDAPTNTLYNESSNFYVYEPYTPIGIHAILETKQTFTVFPNPSKGILFVGIESKPKNDFIELYDITGKTILFLPINPYSKQEIINIGELSAGIYFIKIGQEVQKFIKE